MNPSQSVAVLVTCHNRRETTSACLEALRDQAGAGSAFSLFPILVDDGSSDGSAEAVAARFPEVTLLRGDGALFWCGGTRMAFAAALDHDPPFDFYLWLNDDALLDGDAIARLLACHRDLDPASLVIGAMRDPDTGRTTYGGQRKAWLVYYRLAEPAGHPVRVDTMNGNCVLIPHEAAVRIGNIAEELTHVRGDYDYGLRANEVGCPTWLAPGHFGACAFNKVAMPWRSPMASLRRRFELLEHPKYMMREKVLFARRHHGVFWFLGPLLVYSYILATQPLGWPARIWRACFGR